MFQFVWLISSNWRLGLLVDVCSSVRCSGRRLILMCLKGVNEAIVTHEVSARNILGPPRRKPRAHCPRTLKTVKTNELMPGFINSRLREQLWYYSNHNKFRTIMFRLWRHLQCFKNRLRKLTRKNEKSIIKFLWCFQRFSSVISTKFVEWEIISGTGVWTLWI